MRSLSPVHTGNRRRHGSSLHECVLRNDVNGVKSCLAGDVMCWNTRDVNGVTPLMVAAMLKRLEILKLLVTSRCDVNNTDTYGNTALHLAVDEGHSQIVAELVSSGRCIVDATNARDETALMRAAFYDYSDVTRILLIDGSANADVRNTNGQTALLIALQEGSHVTADMLVKHGCDVTHMDNLGRSAMFMAIHSPCIKSLDVAKTLIGSGYDIRQDKMWMLNEEKPNLFYQDDTFYSNLRNQLHHFPVDTNNNTSGCSLGGVQRQGSRDRMETSSPCESPRQIGDMTSPFVMSPTLKEKIMSSDSGKVTLIPFSKLPSGDEDIRLASPGASPLHVRRSLLQASMSPSWSRSVTPLSCSAPVSAMTLSSVTRSMDPHEQNNPAPPVTKRHTQISDVTSRRQLLVKSASEGSCSKTLSPSIKYRRQMSAQSNYTSPNCDMQQSYSSRKMSLPAKHAVKFSSKIQVIDVKRS